MDTNKPMTEKESLQLITEMIGKVKNNYHDSGISALLWGTAVALAGFLTFFQLEYKFSIGFSVWYIVLLAIIPQVYLSLKASKNKKFKSYEDTAMDAIWITYAITLTGLVLYMNIVPGQTDRLMNAEGWSMIKHYNDWSKPDEPISAFPPSLTSIFILVYAFPTLATGWVKKCKPMVYGALLAYVFFVISFYTTYKYDMLLAGFTALSCWFFPGIYLRRRYLKAMKTNV